MPVTLLLKPDIYPIWIGVWVGKYDHDKILRWLHRIGIWNGLGDRPGPPSPDADACCFCFTGGKVAIWLPRRPTTPNDISTVVHEALHAAGHLGRQLGFSLTPTSDEFYAYLIGYIVSEVLTSTRK